jgi:hypothetical protein
VAARQIAVTAVDDPPTLTVPGAQMATQSIVFSTARGNSIVVNDVDAGGNLIEVSLMATNGRITLASTKGLSFVTGDGRDDGTVRFSGSMSNINTALNGLAINAKGMPGTLYIGVNDQGHKGLGGPKATTASVAMTILAGPRPAFVVGQSPVVITQQPITAVQSTSPVRPDMQSSLARFIVDRAITPPHIPQVQPASPRIDQEGKGVFSWKELKSDAFTTAESDIVQDVPLPTWKHHAESSRFIERRPWKAVTNLGDLSRTRQAPSSSVETERASWLPARQWNAADQHPSERHWSSSIVVGAALGVAVGCSVGYALSCFCGASLSAGTLAIRPLWRSMNPGLPALLGSSPPNL